MNMSHIIAALFGVIVIGMLSAVAYTVSRNACLASEGKRECDLYSGLNEHSPLFIEQEAWEAGHRAALPWTRLYWVVIAAMTAMLAASITCDWSFYVSLWTIIGGLGVFAFLHRLIPLIAYLSTTSDKETTDG